MKRQFNSRHENMKFIPPPPPPQEGYVYTPPPPRGPDLSHHYNTRPKQRNRTLFTRRTTRSCL